jgi:hypothetical protein
MGRIVRIVVRVSIAVAVICVVAAAAVIWIAARGMCGNTVLSKSSSPDGTFRAIVFDRSCGALSHGSSAVKATWVGKNYLQVAYHASSRVALARQDIAGATVRYAVLP